MEAPLPTYDQMRDEIHRETPDVGQHDLIHLLQGYYNHEDPNEESMNL